MGSVINHMTNTNVMSSEEGDWQGYSFTPDHIIKVYERLVHPKDAKAFVMNKSTKNTEEIHYKDFIDMDLNDHLGEIESNGTTKYGTVVLPKGKYNLYPYNDKIVIATPPMDDLPRYASMNSQSPKNIIKTGDMIDDNEPSEFDLGLSYKDQKKYSGPSVYYGGISKDLIKTRIGEIYKIALWAKTHGYSQMYAS